MYSKLYNAILESRQTGRVSKVTLIQQKIRVFNVQPPHLYHVGLVLEDETDRRIFEHGPVQYDPLRSFDDAVIVPLPSVSHTVEQVQAYQDSMPDTYIPGIRDCRHHVIDLLAFLYGYHEKIL